MTRNGSPSPSERARDLRGKSLLVFGIERSGLATSVWWVVARNRPTSAADDTGSIGLPGGGGYRSFPAAKADLGSPGPGNVFDHVVEQSQAKPTRSGFAVEEINTPFNMNPVSAQTNQIKANYYSSKQDFSGNVTVRNWLNGQPFADQYRFGMQILADIRNGVIS